jgi:hypothetical protein
MLTKATPPARARARRARVSSLRMERPRVDPRPSHNFRTGAVSRVTRRAPCWLAYLQSAGLGRIHRKMLAAYESLDFCMKRRPDPAMRHKLLCDVRRGRDRLVSTYCGRSRPRTWASRLGGEADLRGHQRRSGVRPFETIVVCSTMVRPRPVAALPGWYPVRKECAQKRSSSTLSRGSVLRASAGRSEPPMLQRT